MNGDPTSLERLHDVIAPPAAPWWPPAPGWCWVLGCLALLLLMAGVRLVLQWQRNAYRREALAELARWEGILDRPAQRAAGLAEILKRTALSAWPRATVASLTGPDWLAFLNRTGRGRSVLEKDCFALETVTYDPRLAKQMSVEQLRNLEASARAWINGHRAEKAVTEGGANS